MRPARLGALLALIYIAFVFATWKAMPNQDMVLPYVMLNTLLLLVSIALGLFFHRRQEGYEKTSFIQDVKVALQGGMVYAVIVSGYIYLHYSKLDTNYLDNQVNVRVEQYQEELADPDRLAEIRNSQPELSNMTREDILDEFKKTQRKVLNPGMTFTLSLMGLVMLSFLYSLIVTLIFRKLIFR